MMRNGLDAFPFRALLCRSILIFSGLLFLCLPGRVFAAGEAGQGALLWGFQRGCQPLSDETRDVQAHLEVTVTRPVDVLLPPAKWLGCQGAECASQVQRSCPAARRPIMGGVVDQNAERSLTRVRLWLHDPHSGQTAYHDNYCQNCDVTSMLKVNAAELMQHPNLGAAPGPLPMYCHSDAPMKDLPPRSGKIFWVVYGREVNKLAITMIVRKQVQKNGPDVAFQHVGQDYSLGVLKRIIGKEPGAQVLTVEILPDGVVELFLYDDVTELTEVKRVQCAACDRDSFLEQVKSAALNILSHCFGDSCARAGRSRAPAEACRPFEAPRCDGVETTMSLVDVPQPAAPVSAKQPPEMSPRLARLTKGAVWSFFAASAATTAILLAANYGPAGRVQVGSSTANNALLPAVGATAALSLISLGIAIPTTILVDRAASGRTETRRTSESSAPVAPSLQCSE